MEKRSWHPAFSEGVRLVWDPKENNLEFSPEFAVTSEPIKTDILIVKKDPNVKFEDHIGSSFKEYNFIQFKSCTDNFLLHDLLTEFGYVGTYFGRKSDELLLGLDFKEKTMITVFCSNRPENVLTFAGKYDLQVVEKHGIIYLSKLPIPVQIVQLGVVEGADELQYAPIKAFAKGADRKFFENLAKFRIRKIPDSDEEKVESYDCIINLFWQKRYRSIQETLVYLREVLKMSEKDIAKMFLPNAWMEEKKSNWVDFMKVMLKEHRLNLDEAADSPSRPEFLTRDEAFTLLTQEAS